MTNPQRQFRMSDKKWEMVEEVAQTNPGLFMTTTGRPKITKVIEHALSFVLEAQAENATIDAIVAGVLAGTRDNELKVTGVNEKVLKQFMEAE